MAAVTSCKNTLYKQGYIPTLSQINIYPTKLFLNNKQTLQSNSTASLETQEVLVLKSATAPFFFFLPFLFFFIFFLLPILVVVRISPVSLLGIGKGG